MKTNLKQIRGEAKSALVAAVMSLALFGATAAEKPSLVVSTATDIINPDDGLISLREAFLYAQEDEGVISEDGGYKITFDSAKLGSGVYAFNLASNIVLEAAKFADKRVIIDGAIDAGDDLTVNAGDLIAEFGDGTGGQAGTLAPTIKTDVEDADFDFSVNYVRFNGVSLDFNVKSLRAKFDTCEFRNAGLELEAVGADSNVQIINSTFVSNDTGVALAAPAGATFLAINSSFGDNSVASIHLKGGVKATILASTVVKSGIGINNESTASATLYNALVADNTTDVYGYYDADYSLIGLSESVTREAVFGANGAVLAYKTVSGKTALMPTYAILSGADAADGTPSVAGGLGAWFRYYTNPDDNFITEVDMSALSTTRGMNVIWGAKDDGDAETRVVRDETGTDFSSNLPSAGAYWVYTEVPSLVVTTVKDVVNGSDGETSLREAVAYARRLAADSESPVTITFDKIKIEDEAGHIPSDWEKWTIYLGKSFTWKRGNSGRGEAQVGGNSDGVLNLAGTDCGLVINGNFDTGLDITIDGNSTRDLFAFDENSKLQLKDIRLQHAANTFTGETGAILYLNRASICDMTNALNVGTLILEESSIHNVTSLSTAKLSAQNSTIGVSGKVQINGDAQLLNATVKGEVEVAGNLNAVNSLIEGTCAVSGTEWKEYCAFDHDLGFDEISIEGDDAHRGYYTFSTEKDWAKYGTILQRDDTDFTWTSGAFPGYNWGVRWEEGKKSEWSDIVNLTPDVWHCWPVGVPNDTVTILEAGIVKDLIDQLRIPHKGYCSMGAWAAYTAVAWKSNTSGSYLGTGGSSWVSRNNYYYYVQDGVDSLAEDEIDDELNEEKETLYLVGTTITDERLADSSRSIANTVIIEDNPTCVYGTSWINTCLKSTNSVAVQVIGKNVALLDFAIAGGKDGVTITNAAVYASRLSVNSNSGDAVKVEENSTLEMVNSTVALNGGEGILVASGSTATLIDVTVAGNDSGLNGAGTINAANTLVWKNTENYGGTYNLAYPVGEAFAEDVTFAPNGRQVAVSYNGLAGWSGTKVAKVDGEYVYLERGNATDGWLARDQWTWKTLVGRTATTAPTSFISVDQALGNRFGAEAIGFDEFTIGAYQPDVKMTVRLVDQWTTYNSMAQVMSNSDAIFEIETAAAGLHGQSSLYYSVADGRLYENYEPVTNANGMGWTDALSVVVSDVTDLSLSASVTSKSSGQLIHANAAGYATGVSQLAVNRGGVSYSDTYSVTYDGNAKFIIFPREISLCEAITPTKVFDGNTQVVIGEEGLRKAGVLNAEVAIECDKVGINYATKNVIAEEAQYYKDNGAIRTNDNTRLVIDWSNVAFSGNALYLGDYTVKKEDLYAIILPKPITITPKNAEKIYDGSTGASGQFVYSDSLVGGDSYTGEMEIEECGPDAGVYTNTFEIGTYTVQDGNSGANYALTLASNATYTIKKKAITLNVKVDSRVYNGSDIVSPATAVDHTPQETGVGTETLAIASLGENNATYASKHVSGEGAEQKITIADPSLVELTEANGAKASNYAITYSASGAITKRSLTLDTISSTKSRVYDGTKEVSVDTDDQSTYAFTAQSGDTGLVSGEDLKLSGTGSAPSSQEGDFSDDKVTWEISSLKIANGSKGVANDYDFTGFASGSNETESHVVIVRFPINIALSAKREYDGSTNVAVSVVSMKVTDGDGKSLTFTEEIVDETNKVFTITTGLTDGDNDEKIKLTVWDAVLSDNANAKESWDNRMLADCRIEGVNADLYDYRFTIGSAVLEVTTEGTTAYTFADPLTNSAWIAKRPITLTADSGEWVYDAATHTVDTYKITSGSFVGGEGIETLSMTEASKIRNVGTVANTIDKYTLKDGTLEANYTITKKTGTLKVTAKPITITATKPADVTYGEDAVLNYSSTGLSGEDSFSGELAIAGDKSTSGNYVYGDHEVTRGTLAINDGNGGKNYSVTYEKSSFNVAKKTITVKFEANDKVYDATTNATRKGDFIYTGVEEKDVIGLDDSTMVYAFDTKDVGTDKTVTATSFDESLMTGVDHSNYTVAFVGTTSADVTKRRIDLALPKATKVYDGNVAYSGTELEKTYPAQGDEYFEVSLSGQFADKNVADSSTGFSVQTLGLYAKNGASYDNYDVYINDTKYTRDYDNEAVAISAPGAITKRDVTITANGCVVPYDGQYHTVTTWTVSGTGFVDGEGISAITPTAESKIRNVGTVANTIDSCTPLSGTSLDNYAITKVAGKLMVTARPITITATANGITYGEDATLAYTQQGLQSGDEITGALTIDAENSTAGKLKSGTYEIKQGTIAINDGNDGKNYTVTYVKDNVTVGKKTLTITFEANDKDYDATTAATRKGDFIYTGVEDKDLVTLDDSQMTYAFVASDETKYENQDAETGKYVYAHGFKSDYLSGADLANYTVTFVTNSAHRASITPLRVEFALDTITKTYDSTVATPALTNVTTVAGVNEEAFTIGAIGEYISAMAADSNRYFKVDTLVVNGKEGGKLSNYDLCLKDFYVEDYDSSLSLSLAPNAEAGQTEIVLDTFEVEYAKDGGEAAPHSCDALYASGVINKKPLTITADNKTGAIGTNPNDVDGFFTFTYDGFEGSDTNDAPAMTTLPSAATAYTGDDITEECKNFDIVPSGAVAANYEITYVNGTLKVWGIAQYPTAVENLIYNGEAQTGVNVPERIEIVEDSAWTSASATTVGVYAVTFKPTSPYTWTGGSDTNVTVVFTIANATITDIEIGQHGAFVYGATNQTVAVTNGCTTVGEQPSTFYYSTSKDGPWTTAFPQFKDAGTHTVWYKVSAPNHNDTEPTSMTVTIDKKPLTITADNKTGAIGTNPNTVDDFFTFTYDGIEGSDTNSAPAMTTLPSAATDYHGEVVPQEFALFDIVPSGSVASNYAITYVKGTLKVWGMFKITYQAQGGKFEDEAETKTIDTFVATGYQLPENPIREGYKFLGWYDSWTNHAVQVTNDMPLVEFAAHNIFAKWDSTTVPSEKVEEKIESGDGEYDDTTIIYGAKKGKNGELMSVTDENGAFVVPDRIPNDTNNSAVVAIASDAFIEKKYTGLIKSLTTPLYLRKIGSRAFYSKEALSTLTITPPVKYDNPLEKADLTICTKAFAGTAIESLLIPEEVTTIEKLAFTNCKKLKSVTFAGNVAMDMPATVFQRCGYDNGTGTLKIYATKKFKEANASFFDGIAAVNPSVTIVPMIGISKATAASIAALGVADDGTIALTTKFEVTVQGTAPDVSEVKVWVSSDMAVWKELTIIARESYADGTAVFEVKKPTGDSAFFKITK